MGKWYIDRSRNVSSIVSSIHFELLKRLINTKETFIDPNVLIDELQIDGANKNALLTNFRDLGLIDENNRPSGFFCACIEANLPVAVTILLILLKRNDEKKGKNSVKPFVVISKALAQMIEHGLAPELTWGICDTYLMAITTYEDISWENLKKVIDAKPRVLSTPVLDIWFNALIATQLFGGDKKQVVLKSEYYDFIKFISKYGSEMSPSQNRDEYLAQANDAKYGWYELFLNHSYDAVCASKNIPSLISYIQTQGDECLRENTTSHFDSNYDFDKLNKTQLEEELDYLRSQEAKISDRINKIQARLTRYKENDRFLTIKTNVENEALFAFYLQNNKELSDHTISSYFQSLRKMKDIMGQYEQITLNTEIYFINDVSIIEALIARYEANDNLKEINKKDHYSISAAYNNYYEFLKTMREIG